MSKRIITVDPNLLHSSGSKTSRKSKRKYDKTRKAEKTHNVNYEKLLGKIKEMKKNRLEQTKKKNKLNIMSQKNIDLSNSINNKNTSSSLEMCDNENIEITPETTFSKNTSTTKPINVENPQISLEPTNVSTPLSIPPPLKPILPVTIHPDPQYGILKNGKKPTRRSSINTTNKPNTRFEKLRTIKRKYKLGKNDKKISVLLKDNKTRKKIKSEIQDLKQKSIKEVRKFLQERNMIKAGSIAPNNVLRKMYEDMYLTGNIENKNSENLIHNYVNNEESIN